MHKKLINVFKKVPMFVSEIMSIQFYYVYVKIPLKLLANIKNDIKKHK